MQDPEPFYSVQSPAFRSQGCKASDEICLCSGKERSGFLNVRLSDRNGHIFLLNDAVGVGRLFQQHLIVFVTVLVQSVSLVLHQDSLFKIRASHMMIANRELDTHTAVHTVQKLLVGLEYSIFVLVTRHTVVDIRESPAFGIFVSNQENTVRPYPADRDDILYRFRNLVLFLIRLYYVSYGFQHPPYMPPSRVL